LPVSPDKKALLTTSWSNRQHGWQVICSDGFARISFALSLTGADPGQRFPFFVQGLFFLRKGRTTSGIYVNDQSIVADFPGNSENAFLQQMKYRVGDATEARITVYLPLTVIRHRAPP